VFCYALALGVRFVPFSDGTPCTTISGKVKVILGSM
jgi:hypothetical protein